MVHTFLHVTLQYYLSYLNQLRINEYCGAIESLYHYFDSHMLQGANTGNNQAANKSKAEDDVIGRGFRYASLSMAALQFRFGHRLVEIQLRYILKFAKNTILLLNLEVQLSK